MSDVFLGEVRLMAFNFAPTGWASAAGQIVPIHANTALFSLLGTQFGGNGTNNFALPDLGGNCAVGQGAGPGLSDYVVGEVGGTQYVTLLQSEMPAHSHTVLSGSQGDLQVPAGGAVGKPKSSIGNFTNTATGTSAVQLSPLAITPAGNGLPHNNMMPFLVMNWCIALVGIFPRRE
ncbi:MAG TPA: tail fiber protein [Terracidiphilus sp.]|nr:tail fiber protein [Terracidiphilus sp.]